ncbi:MAG: hypothetical protein PQJ50_01250 [Spirochaetales bacterium]|nr:hypothetical protein [Spirochaetales bacterium]
MKKLFVSLVLLSAFTSGLFAEVTVGGWLETKGTFYQKNGDNDAVTGFGSNDAEITVKADFGAYGGEITVGDWSFGAWGEDQGTDSGTVIDALAPKSFHLWTDFNTEGAFKLYAGQNMEVLDYSPNSITGILPDKYLGDQFGRGMGKYDFHGDVGSFNVGSTVFTSGVSGLIAEGSYGGLTMALTYQVPGADGLNYGDMSGNDFNDAMKDAFIVNVKYDLPEVAMFYAGVAPRYVENFFGSEYIYDIGIWAATSIKAVPNLMLDFKYEANFPEDTDMLFQEHWVSANVGYNVVDVINIESEINLIMAGDTAPVWHGMLGVTLLIDPGTTTSVGLKLSPAVPVVGFSLQGGITSNSEIDGIGYAVGAEVTKSFGMWDQFTNSVWVSYDAHTDVDDSGTFSFGYGISMWF